MRITDIDFQFRLLKRCIAIIISPAAQVLRDSSIAEGLNMLKAYYLHFWIKTGVCVCILKFIFYLCELCSYVYCKHTPRLLCPRLSEEKKSEFSQPTFLTFFLPLTFQGHFSLFCWRAQSDCCCDLLKPHLERHCIQ